MVGVSHFVVIIGTTIFNSSWFLRNDLRIKKCRFTIAMLVYQRDPGQVCHAFHAQAARALPSAPKAAGGGHREGDPVAAGDGDDSTSKFGMIYH